MHFNIQKLKFISLFFSTIIIYYTYKQWHDVKIQAHIQTLNVVITVYKKENIVQ